MSGDEVVATGIGAVGSVVLWFLWYLGPRRIRRLGKPATGQWLLDLAPLVAAAILIIVLRTVASYDVRDDVRYLTMYFLLGAAWVGAGLRCLPLVGVSVRDDVTERANGSAACTIAGAMLALTLCFAGGNIGDGPGWWVVIFSAGLATIGLFLAWLVLESLASVSDVITIDRDPAAGLRVAGLLIACGVVFGVAAAGSWVSARDTVRSFLLVAWPVVILVAIAAVVERQWRPTPDTPAPSTATYGIMPALLYVGVAAVYAYQSWPVE